MQHNGDPSTSSNNGSMAEEHGARTPGMEEEAIPWMVEPHMGMETIIESSTEGVCKEELDNYLDYVWRRAVHERKVSKEQ